MPAQIGVSNLFGISAPSGCVVTSSEYTDSVEIKTIRSQTGVTVQAEPVGMAETRVKISGKGIPALSLVTANSSIYEDTLVTTEVNITESNEDYPEWDITAVSWFNL